MVQKMPATPTVQRALHMARSLEHPAIANHSVRTALLALHIADRDEDWAVTTEERETIAVAGVLHDVGTADRFNGARRFEVEGADAAAEWVSAEGWSAPRVDRLWEAIALHTSPQIAEARGGVVRCIRLAVITDFGADGILPAGTLAHLEQDLPRLDVERELARAVVTQAAADPSKAPDASWPGNLLRSHLEDPLDGGLNPSF